MSERSEGKATDRRRAMKKMSSKKSSKSSGNLAIHLPLKSSKNSKSRSPVGKHTRGGSSGSQSVRIAPLVNFAVPPLQLEVPSKKAGREGGKNFRSHKGGAGFKSRCTDHERWHQYQVDEGNFSEPTFYCPFVFIGKEVACEPTPPTTPQEEEKKSEEEEAAESPSAAEESEAAEATSPASGESSPRTAVASLKAAEAPPSPKGRKRPERNMSRRELKRRPGTRDLGFHVSRKLSMLDDSIEIVNSVVQFKTLEQFNVKKFSHTGYVEWEAVWREKILDQMSQDKDSKKSLKKMKEKSLGIGLSATSRGRSRSRGPSDAYDKEEKKKRSESRSRNVSTKELSYGNVHAHVNPLHLLQEEERRARSLTHKKDKKRRSTLTGLAPTNAVDSEDDGPRTSRVKVIDPKTASDENDDSQSTVEGEVGDSEALAHATSEPGLKTQGVPDVAKSPRSVSEAALELRPESRVIRGPSSQDDLQVNPYTLLGKEPPRQSVVSKSSEDEAQPVGFLPLLNAEDVDAFQRKEEEAQMLDAMTMPTMAMPRRSSSARANLSGGHVLSSLFSLNVKEMHAHNSGLSPRTKLSPVPESLDGEDPDSAVSKGISPLRLFSPRKKTKKATSPPASASEESDPMMSPSVKSGLKRKKSGYFSTLKLQLKTPRGKAKDDQEAPLTPKKKKPKTRKKVKRKKTAMSLDDDYALDGNISARSRRAMTDVRPPPEEPESPPKIAPPPPGRLAGLSDYLEEDLYSDDSDAVVSRSQSHRVELRTADSDQTPTIVAALVDSNTVLDKRASRLSLPLSLRSPRHLVSKSDTEAGMVRHGPVRFEVDASEQDAPSDEN